MQVRLVAKILSQSQAGLGHVLADAGHRLQIVQRLEPSIRDPCQQHAGENTKMITI